MADDDISRWIIDAKFGDDQAAEAIWNAYSEKLIRYARKKLAGMPHRAVDEEDVVLSAMNGFFEGLRTGRLDPKNRNELWKLLATITVRKATAQLRRHYATKRGGGEVRGESVFFDQVGRDGLPIGINQVLDDNHLPEFAERLIATCEDRFAALEDESLRQVAVLRLEGYSNEEIAEKLNLSLATIKRKLVRIREKWLKDDDDL